MYDTKRLPPSKQKVIVEKSAVMNDVLIGVRVAHKAPQTSLAKVQVVELTLLEFKTILLAWNTTNGRSEINHFPVNSSFFYDYNPDLSSRFSKFAQSFAKNKK